MSSRYKAMMRRRLLEDVLSRMSEEERRTFMLLSMDDSRHDEVMSALQEQRQATEDLSRRVGRYPFATDLLANVTGNAITGGLLWIGKTLLGK